MFIKHELETGKAEEQSDWVGNNAAFTCPNCCKVFLVSAHLHKSGRACPECGKSTGFVTGSSGKECKAYQQWDTDQFDDRHIEYHFEYSATLRIFGDGVDFDLITNRLGIEPTHVHRKGEKRSSRHSGYEHDMWRFMAPVPRSEPLEKHIETLWSTIRPHKDFLLELKHRLTVDVFLGYRSNCDHAGVEVPHTSLEIFNELEIPFGLSIIVA